MVVVERAPALPVVLRTPLLVVAVCCGLGVALIGGSVVGTGTAAPVDIDVQTALNGPFLHSRTLALAVDWCGEPIGAALLSCVLALACALVHFWRLALLAVAGQGIVGAATGLLKPIFDRTIHGGFLSYPSGHTAGATALAIVLGLLLARVAQARRGPGVAIVLGTAVAGGLAAAWAQILLAAHYPTDTLGGFLLALTLVLPAALLLDRVGDRLAAQRGTPVR